MYLFYTNEYRIESAHSRELLAMSIGELVSSGADAGVSPEIAALSDKTMRSYIDENIKMNKNGKPRIVGVPHYSISHGGNTWAIVFSDTPCGLDIQYNREAKLENIASKFYQKDEQESMRCLGVGEFFRIWSRREALIKAVGSTVFSDVPSTMGKSAIYEGVKWRIYDIALDFEMDNECADEPSFNDGQMKQKRPHAAIAVREDSSFAGTGDIKLFKLEL